MRKIILILSMLLVGSVMSAKQCVEYYRYNFSFNVASDAKSDLEDLISKGYRIIGFSLDYKQSCMIVVYDDNKEK
jgi:hypothetical protein